ncbi:MAG TPA: indole-3-glycerol phosphate synthase TrpC [Thermoanaerobaculia bacterium]|nr:indole-3-glycerol phosphate synthase TrpC [Thermoanaerobaculia bacterium]
MSGVLEAIVRRTRERLAAEQSDVEQIRRLANATSLYRKPHAFSAALKGDGINVISEIKAASPSAGAIVENPDVEQIAGEYKRGGAAAISIVAEPEFFHGSPEWIGRASRASGLPVIMKDFVVQPSQIFRGVAVGADAVLLLASLLDSKQLSMFIGLLDELECDALVEVHDDAELEVALAAGARVIGVNNRDLRTFKVDLATSERLAPRIPSGIVKVAESGIGTHDDIRRLRAFGFDAFLVGESLLRQNDRAGAVRKLRGVPSS